jgi:hypothetical protein
VTTIRVTDDTPIPLVRDVIEQRTRRLMAELARTPNSWPTRAEHKALRGEVDAALDEFNRLIR